VAYDQTYAYPNYYSHGYDQRTDNRNYLQLGHDWSRDLRLDIATWDQFVAYVKAYILNAPPTARDDFRRGFIAGYGVNAEAAFDKVLKQAAPPPQLQPQSGASPGS
jgi:hypothetical protein